MKCQLVIGSKILNNSKACFVDPIGHGVDFSGEEAKRDDRDS